MNNNRTTARIWHSPHEQPRDGYVIGDINGRLVALSYFEGGVEYTQQGRPSVSKCKRWAYVEDILKLK
jgi:hypothetical protein